MSIKNRIYSVPPPPPPPVFLRPQLQIICCYSTLLYKKIARAREGHKKFMLTKLGGGGREGGGRGTEYIPKISSVFNKNRF